MWIIPRNLPQAETATYYEDDISQLAGSLMYRGNFLTSRAWTSKGARSKATGRKRTAAGISLRHWFAYLEGRISDSEAFLDAYVASLPVTSSSKARKRISGKYSRMSHAKFRNEVAEKNARLTSSANRTRAERANEVVFFFSSSLDDSTPLDISYAVKLNPEHQTFDWASLESGVILRDPRLASEKDSELYLTPLKGGLTSMTPRKVQEALQGVKGAHFELVDQLYIIENMEHRAHRLEVVINTRWVETLMGIPQGLTDPSATTVTNTYELILPSQVWRNNP